METLKNELHNTNKASCKEKTKNNIDDVALKTITHFQSCIEKVTDAADTDMNSLAFERSLLAKEIHNIKVKFVYMSHSPAKMINSIFLIFLKF